MMPFFLKQSPRLAAVNGVQRLRIRKARRQLTPDRDIERPRIFVIALMPDSRRQRLQGCVKPFRALRRIGGDCRGAESLELRGGVFPSTLTVADLLRGSL